jgi:hypothetical protein
MMDRQSFQGSTGACLGNVAGLNDRAFEFVAKISG